MGRLSHKLCNFQPKIEVFLLVCLFVYLFILGGGLSNFAHDSSFFIVYYFLECTKI